MGASELNTLDGPPEKIIPFGFSLFMSSKEVSNGKSSAYTEKSLILLHMRWLYWEPKSKTMILSIISR